MAMLDLRRTDIRTTSQENPYWVSSAEIKPEADDKEAVLFSFPLSTGPVYNRGLFLVTAICCEIIIGFAGGTILLDIGLGTIPLETSTDGATVTTTDLDEYIPTADITSATPATYFPDGGDFVTALAAATFAVPVQIVPLDATVPVILATLTSDAAITAGSARVHALMHRVPLMG